MSQTMSWAKEPVAMHLRNCEKSTEDEKKLYLTQAKSIQNKYSLNFDSGKSSQENSINIDQSHNQNISQELKHAITNFIYKYCVSFHCVELDCFKEIFAVIDPDLIDAIPS
ncbi:hypothetical protein PVAND_008059 [Polypedilum vanderplanki]|uniref:Uncharacterized protein n=1 Tax=Polypedilum vanderplanki TaxID=319348 RepID=A0A9J6C9D3_POLVA|nr:hypothetical protein PVAND_008059 [Polypedilum vanderplanki]